MQRLPLPIDHAALDQPRDPGRHHLGVQTQVLLRVERSRPRQVHARFSDADLDRRSVRQHLAHVARDRLSDLRGLCDSQRPPHLLRRQPRHRRADNHQPVKVARQVIYDRLVLRLQRLVLDPPEPRIHHPLRDLDGRHLDEACELAHMDAIVPVHRPQPRIDLSDRLRGVLYV